MPTGEFVYADRMWPGADVHVEGWDFRADLIVFGIQEFDVILGMDWLTRHHARLDCSISRVSFRDGEGTYVPC